MLVTRNGSYQIRRGQTPIGEEDFTLEPRPGGGLFLRSLSRFHWPAGHRLAITQEIGPSGLFLSFSALLEPEGDEPIAGEYRAEGDAFVARVRRGDEDPVELRFEWQAENEVEFASPLFNQVALSHLRLEEGQSLDLDVLWVALPSLEVQPARERYERLADEDLILPVGHFRTRRYRLKAEAEEEFYESLLWVDARGLVLKMEGSFDGVEGEVILTRLESRE
jgi:hypothetical protein